MDNKVILLLASIPLLLAVAHTSEAPTDLKCLEELLEELHKRLDMHQRRFDIQQTEDKAALLKVFTLTLANVCGVIFCGCLLIRKAKSNLRSVSEKQQFPNPLPSNTTVDHSEKQQFPNPLPSNTTVDHSTLTLIGLGYHGTAVYSGIYEGRLRALKRLVDTYHSIPENDKEIILNLDHPNVLRCYGYIYDEPCTFVVSDLCGYNLNNLIEDFSNSVSMKRKSTLPPQTKEKIHLWESDGYPSKQLIELIKNIIHGLGYLHNNRIIHLNLKPSNVLIQFVNDSIVPKLSDMGINKPRVDDSLVSPHVTDHKTSGCKTSKLFFHDRHSISFDMFSLGHLISFCVTKGKRPFGDCRARQYDIWDDDGDHDNFGIYQIPEAHDLVNKLLNHTPTERVNTEEILRHPFFWDLDTKMAFVAQICDTIKGEMHKGRLESLVEEVARKVFKKDWRRRIHPAIVFHFRKQEKYTYSRLTSLLRLMRNSTSHFTELANSVPLHDIVGSEELDDLFKYFCRQFPALFVEVYNVINANDPYNASKEFIKYIW